jgi:hypothetical protein
MTKIRNYEQFPELGQLHTMDMRMQFKRLIPRVQNTQEADQGSEALRGNGYFEQCCGSDWAPNCGERAAYQYRSGLVCGMHVAR